MHNEEAAKEYVAHRDCSTPLELQTSPAGRVLRRTVRRGGQRGVKAVGMTSDVPGCQESSRPIEQVDLFPMVAGDDESERHCSMSYSGDGLAV